MIVYTITNSVNGKIYVGITSGVLRVRWNNHRRDSRTQSSPLYHAIRKYGIEKFRIAEIARASTLEELKRLEREYIKTLGSHVSTGRGYNASYGGDGNFGAIRSPATRARLRAANLGKKHSEESRRRMSEARRGKPMSERWRAAVLAAVAKPEYREKQRLNSTGRPYSAATRKKLSALAYSRWARWRAGSNQLELPL